MVAKTQTPPHSPQGSQDGPERGEPRFYVTQAGKALLSLLRAADGATGRMTWDQETHTYRLLPSDAAALVLALRPYGIPSDEPASD